MKSDSDAYRADDRFVISNNSAKYHIIEQVHNADGTRIWVDTTKLPLFINEGNIFGILGVYDDITERKEAEEVLRKSEARNKAILQDAIGRVSSIRILYDKLLINDDYKDISVKNYIESLIDAVYSLFSKYLKITIEKKIEELNLSSKKLFPLGIILNELLTNILKYAFDGGKPGLIDISLSAINNQVTLIIQDNGKGLPEGFNISKSKGFGLMLVEMLSKQLKGTFTIENHNGTKSILKFNI